MSCDSNILTIFTTVSPVRKALVKMKQYLVVLVCLGVLTWVVLGAPNSRKKSCCLKYSNVPPRFKRIQGYEIQEKDGRCRINAVVFFVNGIRICSDPDDEKVKKTCGNTFPKGEEK